MQENYLEMVRQSERKASPEVAITLEVLKEMCCTPDFLYYCDHNIASRKINLSQMATNPVKKTKMKEMMTMMTKRQMGKAGRRRSWWFICVWNSRSHFADDAYTQDISASNKAINDQIEAIGKKWKCRDSALFTQMVGIIQRVFVVLHSDQI